MLILSARAKANHRPLNYVEASADLLLGLLHIRGTLRKAQYYASAIRHRQDRRLPQKCRPWLTRLRTQDSDVLDELLAVLAC